MVLGELRKRGKAKGVEYNIQLFPGFINANFMRDMIQFLLYNFVV